MKKAIILPQNPKQLPDIQKEYQNKTVQKKQMMKSQKGNPANHIVKRMKRKIVQKSKAAITKKKKVKIKENIVA